jgi:UDP-N-acetylmuramyl tripeptide synthase
MINLRLIAAILAGKGAGLASRALGRGGGTTIPGIVARRVAPDTLRLLAARLPQGVILVAGTNGKTTTTRMLAACLAADGRRALHNRAGANLISGLTSTALLGSSLAGHPQAEIGLFEADEAALPQALAETQPRLVLLHNLFRDQLDRYGEVDTIAGEWRAALAQLPSTASVLLNADDPSIAGLGEGLRARVFRYGLEDVRHASDSAAHVADAQFCRRCGARYDYQPRFYAHIGHYRCPQCGYARPQPDFRLERLDLEGEHGARLILSGPADLAAGLELHLPLPGRYNALNALAAASAALLLGVPAARVRDTLERFSAAFGRIERVDAGGTPLLMALIKNPVGASETIRMLTENRGTAEPWNDGTTEPASSDGNELSSIVHRPSSQAPPATGHLLPADPLSSIVHRPSSGVSSDQQGLHLLILINDRHADGTDVSWLWDAEFEQLAGHVAHVTVGGTRAEDMAVRLKYAGVSPALIHTEPQPAQALDAARTATPPGATLYALPTYTAMLELRNVLAQRGWVKPFWED